MGKRMRIHVITDAYDGSSGPFPEATHFPEYLAAHLAERFPDAKIEVDEGDDTRVFLYDVPADVDETELHHQVTVAAQVDAWDEFCDHGYLDYAEAGEALAIETGWNVWRFDDPADGTKQTHLGTFATEDEAHAYARRNGGHQVQRGADGEVTGVQQ
jgi:hypothetical protein